MLLAFSMQGWGQLVNQVILLVCLVAFDGTQTPYTERSGQYTFRLSFAFIALVKYEGGNLTLVPK